MPYSRLQNITIARPILLFFSAESERRWPVMVMSVGQSIVKSVRITFFPLTTGEIGVSRVYCYFKYAIAEVVNRERNTTLAGPLFLLVLLSLLITVQKPCYEGLESWREIGSRETPSGEARRRVACTVLTGPTFVIHPLDRHIANQ